MKKSPIASKIMLETHLKKLIHRIFYSLFQKGGMIADRTNSLVRVVGPDKDRFMGEVVCVTSAPREASSLFPLL